MKSSTMLPGTILLCNVVKVFHLWRYSYWEGPEVLFTIFRRKQAWVDEARLDGNEMDDKARAKVIDAVPLHGMYVAILTRYIFSD